MGQMVLRTIPYLGHYSIRIRLSPEIDHNIEEKARTNKIDSCALSHRWKWKVATGNQKQLELVRQITAVLLLYNMNPTVHPDEAVRLLSLLHCVFLSFSSVMGVDGLFISVTRRFRLSAQLFIYFRLREAAGKSLCAQSTICISLLLTSAAVTVHHWLTLVGCVVAEC